MDGASRTPASSTSSTRRSTSSPVTWSRSVSTVVGTTSTAGTCSAAVTPAEERRRAAVPKFLSLFSYSEGSLAAMIDSPADREPQVRAVLESVGAELEVFYWMFGAHDGLAIIEAPDSLTMAG